MMKLLALTILVVTIGSLVEAKPSFRQLVLGGGKADDSCVGRCGIGGTDLTKPCQCNPSCQTYNDCCADFIAVCNTCDGRCTAGYDNKWPCQCTPECSDFNNCCPDKPDLCGGTGGGAVTDAELKALSQQLHIDDVNAVQGIVLNMQSTTTSGSTTDKAPLPLFSSVPADAFSGPTTSALLALFDNYDENCKVTEDITAEELIENDAFLDAILATSVFQQAHQFLVSKGLADADIAVFKEYLRLIWLGQYNRGGGIEGSSGLEHVFLGEKNGNSISGYHGWIKFYQDELAGRMNYLGYMVKLDLGVSSVIEMPMNWDGIYKSISSISVSGSPEIELALATVCFLARPNSKCPLSGADGTPYAYQTYTLSYNGNTYVGSAYPTY
ncbi:uridylate-specific endoribonuclease-like [Daphnia pulicaria]|uniref:uridylate-specific endoribonuclease-like n=1 Tax=Daphnia pulicaria TaxID=35523 RepID=UPI001EEA7DE7|nr:uridylate-specific endoribonuclease-like [Daphnia pulicaria]XP_046643319.1 uridylate-specific endoribonuclease-like [Daphnia pulicaria]XP_046649067.1 uridylate-specific endoribonuclease-like [Daphnia pulicaria]XP_046649068.1 uridylate-specific endoribonuclease-like [Daphnia pulicaria]